MLKGCQVVMEKLTTLRLEYRDMSIIVTVLLTGTLDVQASVCIAVL
jgi:hypothetical protein